MQGHITFVCTANGTAGIPAPLLDRLEVVRLPGYSTCVEGWRAHFGSALMPATFLVPLPPPGRSEKLAIATTFLIPKLLREHGLARAQAAAPSHAPPPHRPRADVPPDADPPTPSAGALAAPAWRALGGCEAEAPLLPPPERPRAPPPPPASPPSALPPPSTTSEYLLHIPRASVEAVLDGARESLFLFHFSVFSN